jgi:hypothetical protein
LQIID